MPKGPLPTVGTANSAMVPGAGLGVGPTGVDVAPLGVGLTGVDVAPLGVVNTAVGACCPTHPSPTNPPLTSTSVTKATSSPLAHKRLALDAAGAGAGTVDGVAVRTVGVSGVAEGAVLSTRGADSSGWGGVICVGEGCQ